jgi:hypothetical protein
MNKKQLIVAWELNGEKGRGILSRLDLKLFWGFR